MSQKQINTVIPAKAGIQQSKHFAKWAFFNQLDSRLRGNDVLGLAGR